jgi:hypothetical protein
MQLRFRSYRRRALGQLGEARMPLCRPMLTSVVGQKPLRQKFVRIHQVLRLPARQRRQPCRGVERSRRAPCQGEGDRPAPPRLQVERSWGRRRVSNPTSAKGYLAALPLSYTGVVPYPMALRATIKNLSPASEFPEHMPRRRVVQPARTSCPSCGSTKLSQVGEDATRASRLLTQIRATFTALVFPPCRVARRHRLTAAA